MHTLDDLVDRLKQEDRVLYLTSLALRKLKGSKPEPFAREILGFLDSHYSGDYLSRYIARCHHLSELQTAFEVSGQYPASTYAEIAPIDGDDYRLSLLLSFLTTVHRFEILQWLVRFLKLRPRPETPKTFLSIGFGAGYEIKLIQDYASDSEHFRL